MSCNWTRIITETDEGIWVEWEPCGVVKPPDPTEPPDPEAPETFRFSLESGVGQWETEAGDNWIQG